MKPTEGAPDSSYYDRMSIEQAFSLWRNGEQYLQRPLQAAWKADYEAAVEVALMYLQGYQTMRELIDEYFSERRAETEGNDWVAHACTMVTSERKLNYGVVEDAAYFRRMRQLVEALS